MAKCNQLSCSSLAKFGFSPLNSNIFFLKEKQHLFKYLKYNRSFLEIWILRQQAWPTLHIGSLRPKGTVSLSRRIFWGRDL